ncbi:MAG: site-specific DNA-methyltransferase [Clostridiales Family XIII bacterium]|nr:site-specific DNA-methyltransferase [Clostridiales Family XIII bacterium]
MFEVKHIISNSFHFYCGNVLEIYGKWPAPQTIISDGAYGVRGFDGDTTGIGGLAEWYRPHLKAWDRFAQPCSALWFWNTEIGWATIHPLIESYGWKYVQTVVWDKGVAHIAGNVNGKTIRQYPVVSEICVLYQRDVAFNTDEGPLIAQKWLRHEWQRSGLPLSKANEACGVKNAATRKYLTQDWLWYWPPGKMVEKMAEYATKYGKQTDRPYFSLDGKRVVTAKEWDGLRYRWNHIHGLTNVWNEGPLHGEERLRGGDCKPAPRSSAKTQAAAFHLNQKPLEFMRRLIVATTNANDTVWEPFGGLASASVAAVELGRHACVAEINEKFQRAAQDRLSKEAEKHSPLLQLIV